MLDRMRQALRRGAYKPSLGETALQRRGTRLLIHIATTPAGVLCGSMALSG